MAYNFTLNSNVEYVNNFELSVKNLNQNVNLNLSITLQNQQLNFLSINQ